MENKEIDYNIIDNNVNNSIEHLNLEYTRGRIKRINNEYLTDIDIYNSLKCISNSDLSIIKGENPPLFYNINHNELIWKYMNIYNNNITIIPYEYMNYEKYETLKSILKYELYLFKRFPYYDNKNKSICKRCSRNNGYRCYNCGSYYCLKCFDHRIHYDYCEYSWFYRINTR